VILGLQQALDKRWVGAGGAGQQVAHGFAGGKAVPKAIDYFGVGQQLRLALRQAGQGAEQVAGGLHVEGRRVDLLARLGNQVAGFLEVPLLIVGQSGDQVGEALQAQVVRGGAQALAQLGLVAPELRRLLVRIGRQGQQHQALAVEHLGIQPEVGGALQQLKSAIAVVAAAGGLFAHRGAG